jgi:GT2 family glycosyltransferase
VTTAYAIVLNNDATADPHLLAAFVEALSDPRHHRVGAVSGKVLLAETGLLNSTGNMMSRTGRGYDRDWRRPDDGARGAGEVFGFCGAAAALRTEALGEVGLFDEDLFLYYEDTDLSWRLRAAGWSVIYEPSAVAWHRHASSSKAGSARFHRWNERNSMVVFTRHAPAPLVGSMLARRAIGLLVHTARDGLTDVTRARWQAAGDYLRRLPRTLVERRVVWRAAERSRAEVAALLSAKPGD